MLSKIVVIIKPLFAVILIVVLLRSTGMMSTVATTAQSAVLNAGFLDASAIIESKSDDFDYNFIVEDIDGKKVSMDKFKGKVVFLNLWATWCGPCRAEMPTIQKLFDNASKENIAFVMLSIDYPKDVSKIVPFIKSKAYTFPVFHQEMKALPEQLQLPSIPATFVISKTGKILSKEIGMTNFNTPEFKKLLESEAKK